jgi:penicillin-binding protein 2
MEELLFITGKEKIRKSISLPRPIFWLYLFLIFLTSLYFIFVNKTKGSYYQELSQDFRNFSILISPKRGEILDKDGKKIAETIPAFDLYLDLIRASQEEKNIFEEISKDQRVFYRGEYALIKFLSGEKIASIILNKEKYPHFEIIPSYLRIYHEGEAFGSVLGYIGFSPESKEDIMVGLSGLEKFYDKYLKGSYGKIIYFRKPSGEKGEKIEEIAAIPGDNIVTTIDFDFQTKAYQLMKEYFRERGYKKGALVAMNPKTGAVIAMISFPSYDPNVFLSDPIKVNEILENPLQPLFNRAVSGLYSPGSTIKPVIAIAALEEGVIDEKEVIYAGGYLKIPHPYIPGTYSIFHDNKVHGWTDLRKAIAESVNVYFYIVGGGYENKEGLGIRRILKWWQIFGLGQKTGIDLPGENSGFLPSPENKYKTNPLDPVWRLGDTYNVSIGQGDLLVTPLQITLWTAALATNKLVKPYIVQRIIDQNGKIVFEHKEEDFWQGILNQDKLKAVQEGMRGTVTYGTGKYLSDLPYKIAGKSGTPEILGKKKLNAIFTGYVPYEDPEIVLTILIEEVPIGSVAVLPLYKEVIKAYFKKMEVRGER